jgi:hypothetical protein
MVVVAAAYGASLHPKVPKNREKYMENLENGPPHRVTPE